jgi:hypothetical protein
VIHLAPDLQLRLTPAATDIELRLWRRPVSDVGANDFAITSIGFKVAAYRAGDLAEAIRDVAAAMAAPAGQG